MCFKILLTALRDGIVGMPCLAVSTSRTPDQHDRCLFLHLWRRTCQSLQIFTADQERRGQVGRDSVVPSLKRQFRQRDVLPGPNPVVHDEDLYRSGVRDGREHVCDGCFVGEVGLDCFHIGVGFREAFQRSVLRIVVGGHFGAERWQVGVA